MKNPRFWKEVCKFLSGAFFVTAGASWYLSWYDIAVPFFNTQMTPKFLFIRGFMHFALFLITFYFGFLRNQKVLFLTRKQ